MWGSFWLSTVGVLNDFGSKPKKEKKKIIDHLFCWKPDLVRLTCSSKSEIHLYGNYQKEIYTPDESNLICIAVFHD